MLRSVVSWCKKQARRIVGSIIALAAFSAMYVAERPVRADMDLLAGQFAFSRHSLPEVPGPTPWYFRDNNMHPELRHLGWFLSAFGAGVAIKTGSQTTSATWILVPVKSLLRRSLGPAIDIARSRSALKRMERNCSIVKQRFSPDACPAIWTRTVGWTSLYFFGVGLR